jgi:renalase
MSLAMNKVAIIGAGIAGLSCARVLAEHGHNVQVFDKGRGPGGRMSTRRAATALGEASFDHGAQYFTARNSDFVREIDRLIGVGAVAPWTGTLVKLAKDGTNSPLANEALYVGTPGMNEVIRGLAAGLSVAWSTRVEAIVARNGTWSLTSEIGDDLGGFDKIVCAVPAEQVAPLIGEIAPLFGARGTSIRSLPCWTGMFAFDRPLCIPFDAIRFEDHAMLDFIAMNHSKPARTGPPSYVVQAHAEWSASHLEDSPETIAASLREALLAISDDAPNLIFEASHRWRYARVETSRGLGCLWDEGLNIGVCGDWLSGPRVEAAWLSGLQLGTKMTAT